MATKLIPPSSGVAPIWRTNLTARISWVRCGRSVHRRRGEALRLPRPPARARAELVARFERERAHAERRLRGSGRGCPPKLDGKLHISARRHAVLDAGPYRGSLPGVDSLPFLAAALALQELE